MNLETRCRLSLLGRNMAQPPALPVGVCAASLAGRPRRPLIPSNPPAA
jgi:hypothetical protein